MTPFRIICAAGMFVLLGGMALWEDAGEQLCEWFAPALEWIQRWMALFYAPFLVALPANAASLVGEILQLAGLRCAVVTLSSSMMHRWSGRMICQLRAGQMFLRTPFLLVLSRRAAAAADSAAAGGRSRAQHGRDWASRAGTLDRHSDALALTVPAVPLS